MKITKHILLIFLFFFQAVTTNAQKVTNVSNRQDQSTIIVSYDLETKSPCKISLFVSTNGGTTWQGPLKKVSGDVGQNINSGIKSINWNILDEFNELVGDKIIFKVSAQFTDAKSNPNIIEALKIKPTDTKTFRTRGEARLAVNDTKGAYSDFTRAIALNPKSAVLYKLRGDSSILTSDFRDTIDVTVARYSSNAPAAIPASSINYEIAAFRDYSKAIALNQRYEEALMARAKLNKETVVSDYSKVISLNPKNKAAYLGRAREFCTQKKYNSAIADYSKAIELTNLLSESPVCDIYNERGEAKKELKDYDGAMNDFNASCNLHNPHGYFLRAKLKLDLYKDKNAAFDDFNQSIQYSKESADQALRIADNQNDMENYENAIIFATKAIELDYDKDSFFLESSPYLTRARSYQAMGKSLNARTDFDLYINQAKTEKVKAERSGLYVTTYIDDEYKLFYYSKAIEFQPNDPQYYSHRGNYYYEKEKYRDAILDYDKAIDLYLKQKEDNVTELDYDSCEDYYLERAHAKSELNDYTGAIADINKAIEISPSRDYFIYLRAVYKDNLRDYRGAIFDYTKYILINPNSVETYLSRGDAKYNIYDFKGAIADYTKAISLDPKYAKAYLWRGHAKIQIKDKIGACKDFSKAGELGDVDAYEAINANCN